MDERVDIFISYASVDRPKAQQIAAALERQGWSVWWDREILPGDRFSQIIEEKLETAKCMLVLWSKTSVMSDWVEAEAAEGKRRGILVPALIDDTDPALIPLEFRRFETAQLGNWEGSSTHEEFALLLRAIKRRLPARKKCGQQEQISGGDERRPHREGKIEQTDEAREFGAKREIRPWWARFSFEFRSRHFVLSVTAALSIAFVLFVGGLRQRLEAPQQTDLPSHDEPALTRPAPSQPQPPPSGPIEEKQSPPRPEPSFPSAALPSSPSSSLFQRLPFFMTRLVTEEDLQGKSTWELDVMRNEIYARHGRRCKRNDLQRYFDRQPWYSPRYAADNFPAGLLSDIQAKNVEFIRDYQRRKGLS
jgi:hypothetical protein